MQECRHAARDHVLTRAGIFKLWLFTFIVVLVLAMGLLLLGFSNLLWTQTSQSALELVAGLVLLVLIFAS